MILWILEKRERETRRRRRGEKQTVLRGHDRHLVFIFSIHIENERKADIEKDEASATTNEKQVQKDENKTRALIIR